MNCVIFLVQLVGCALAALITGLAGFHNIPVIVCLCLIICICTSVGWIQGRASRN
jgi:hypothetical protein